MTKHEETKMLCGVAFAMILMIGAIMTPLTTKHGDFTDPIKYWSSNEYFNNNFK